ncbi:hypothetical protein [Paraburkholderia guartelaensis]|uniref:hypothetical protein n=1 Tax=Paraburkholderia guartelaensis TaxID=2546446 RepID=UPI002AB7416C|nr:hypothetical protein [Paraburkholderia guartelaensis]
MAKGARVVTIARDRTKLNQALSELGENAFGTQADLDDESFRSFFVRLTLTWRSSSGSRCLSR